MSTYRDQPIVIGGTGGSGTRVMVTCLRTLGVVMSHTYDHREDSVPMGRFDRRWGRTLISHAGDAGSPGLRSRLSGKLAKYAFDRARRVQQAGSANGPWGWKHPHSYLLIPFLHDVYPGMRFIHLVRNGLDMAISDNLGQLRRYGDLFVAPTERSRGEEVTAALFWARANLYARHHGLERLGDRYVTVRFEDLCEQPLATLKSLSERLALQPSQETLEAAAQLPRRPNSAGRATALPPELHSSMAASARDALEVFGYLP